MKILIAEDDTTSRLLLAATLKKLGHEVVAAANGEEAREAIGREHVPLLISDWMMPDVDGLELCRLIRSEHSLQYTYIILLSARSGKTNYLGAMDAGADDFITKPFDEDQLAARLRVAERILDLHETLRVQAMHDRLTGLWNRAAIVDSLHQELDRTARERTPVSVILADLDHFKQINDTYGHLAGDAVLREAAQRMRAALRSYDHIGRYGGEEFLIVLPGCLAVSAMVVAERVRERIAATAITIPGDSIAVTSSLGVSASSGGQVMAADALIAAADTALYQAKAAGRNRVELGLTVGRTNALNTE